MKQLPRVLAAWALASVSCVALSQTSAAPAIAASAPASSTPPAQSAMTARLMYELLLSELSFQRGDAPSATALMLDAARRTSDETLFKRAAELAVQSRSGPAALEATRAWRQAYPKSVAAGQYELQVLVVMGRIAETEEAVRRFITTLPAQERVSFITALPAIYQRVPDKTEAAAVVERALSDAIKDPALAPAAWTSIGRLRLQAGDKAGALSAATLGQTSNVQSEWPALLALQLMGAGEASAEAMVKRYLATAGAKPEVRIAYARGLVELGRNAEAHTELAHMTQQSPNAPDAWLVQGALFADERDYARAETSLQRYLDLTAPPASETGVDRRTGRDQARMMLSRVAERRGDLARAEKLLEAVESPEQALAVQVRRADMMARQGKLDAARQAIRSAPERGPDDARLKIQAEAQLLRDRQQPAAAYQLLAEELKKDPDDEGLLYDTAMAAERAGDAAEMERLLRQLIEINPEAANAYNALGYSLADRGQRLPEAKQLIEKAVQLVPDDGYIQDSLGWVEFRMGRVQQARRILEQAFKSRPDAEIAAHLGEVLWTLGDRDGARRIWQEGQRLNAENETLVKTLERFKVAP
ncbi:tetratricopeptide repeat protein [Ottowia sp. GY511]|uniref:Tetratricopeptide repeat protein n=1 Tax=Ottowia flava TaxID=2675430 RepID=A0ABW4KR89_9BURK|nr:tetratricopeptide repeat protein [Ottowia sp. GY511]TXK27876.1 tetratricopeptide repeat protein [Ottowia sp. GY511]